MIKVYDELWVCSDCGFFIVNGMPDDFEKGWSPKLIEHYWPSGQFHLVSGDAEKDHEFSGYQCDACGSHLGGYRFHCVALEG